MKKKLIKAGIASAMICTVLGSTVVPTSAKEVVLCQDFGLIK